MNQPHNDEHGTLDAQLAAAAGEAPGPLARDRMWNNIEAGIAAQPAPPAPKKTRPALIAAAVACAAVAFVVVKIPRTDEFPEGAPGGKEFSARGNSTATSAMRVVVGDLRLSALCMVKAQTCAPTTLTLTTQSATPAHVAVALLGSDGTLLWLVPQGEGQSMAVGPMAVTTVSLKKAAPGPARLLVVRSPAAIDKATARARIEAHVAGTTSDDVAELALVIGTP